MARAPTTSDPFNAVAEPRRRQILDYLSEGTPRTVNELVVHLNLPQPAVSKHLGVLKKVGLVTATKDGQRRLYNLNPHPLKPVHDWIVTFERFWTDHLDHIKKAAEQKARERAAPPPPSNN